MEDRFSIPVLFPFEPSELLNQIRAIVKEELEKVRIQKEIVSSVTKTEGLTEKPLYKLDELCKLFGVSKPTIYEWIKHGKLRRVKIRSRVYFLWNDVNKLFE